uniref:Uncharacterized protein n=1 Tax=Oryza punctata TaxID=4537 RepID=A0A0E0LP70_ORYPU
MTRRARRDGAGSSRRRRGRIISRPFLNSITSACPATFGSKQSTSELNDSLESRNAFISLVSDDSCHELPYFLIAAAVSEDLRKEWVSSFRLSISIQKC